MPSFPTAGRTVLAVLLAGSFGCGGQAPVPTQTKGETASREPLAEALEASNKGIKGTYDQNSLRWMDDQLVIDLVLENPSSLDFQDLDVSVSIHERREDTSEPGVLKKSVKLTSWRKGDKHRVVVPIIDNDLKAEAHPKTIQPSSDRDITGTAVFRKTVGSDSRDYLVHFWGSVEQIRPPASDQGKGPASPFSGYEGTGAVGREPVMARIRLGPESGSQMYLEPQISTRTSDGHKTATLLLKRFQKATEMLPSLNGVKLMLVGYVGGKESFRKTHSTESWGTGEELSIPIEATEITRLKVRGLGRRRATGAEDVLHQQQVYYICEDFVFEWKKR